MTSYDGITRPELAAHLRAHKKIVADLERIDTGCKRCQFINGTFCEKWDATVPDGNLAAGCDEWKYDGIPF